MSDQLSTELKEKVEILGLSRQEATGNYVWEPIRRSWAAVQLNLSKRNIFSTIGIGARDATLILRSTVPVTMFNAVRWKEQFFFITSLVSSVSKDRYDIKAAICDPITLTAKPQAKTSRDNLNRPIISQLPAFLFPGILTELYQRNTADEVLRSGTTTVALIAPKAIMLRAGDLIQQGDDAPYMVRQVLDLDPYKNEYVLERQEDI